MTKYLGVINGKGGVGKTTVSLNLAFCLKDKHKTVLFDANMANPHIGMHLGKRDPEHSLHSSSMDLHHITKAIHDLYGINVVLGSMNRPYNKERMQTMLSGVYAFGETVVVDCPPGDFQHVLEHCDECILVTTPDPISVSEAYRSKFMAKQLGVTVLGFVLNRVKNERHELSGTQVEKFLSLPMLAAIPEDKAVSESLARQAPVVHYSPRAKSSREFMLLAEFLSPE